MTNDKARPCGLGERELQLADIVKRTLWMACRYAHGRQSYAVGMYNEAARMARDLGVLDNRPASDEPIFAIDGSLSPEMSGLTPEEYDAALQGWSKRDAVPNHCRSDWITRTPTQTPEDIAHG